MPSTLKRLFGSPFRGSPKRNNGCVAGPPMKSDESDSTASPTTNPTELFDGDINERNLQEDNDDGFKTTVMLTSSTDSSSSNDETTDSSKTDGSGHSKESTLQEEEDFKTTTMPTQSMERNIPTKEASPDNILSDSQIVSKSTVENDVADRTLSKASKPIDSQDDDKYNESPINSVVFEKHIDTRHDQTGNVEKNGPQMSPLLSPCSDEGFSFDDYRSTISGITEATNFRAVHRMVPPSPTHSTSSAMSKKMENFLKTETEAIRELLSEVDSGDEESTVVEDSVRGANEAERMAREMEREMELLVKGHQQPEEPIEDESVAIDSPGSDLFLTDIRSVIHPSPESSVDQQYGMDDESMISSLSRVSPTSPRRDLFQQRSSLYRLRREKKRRKLNNKRKLRKFIRYFLRTLALLVFLSSAGFVANWKWNYPDLDIWSAAKTTRAQLGTHITIDPKLREEMKALVVNTTKATQAYVGSHLEHFASRLDGAKNSAVYDIKKTSSYLVSEAKYYAPKVAEQTKTHLMHGMKATNELAYSVSSYVWNQENFGAATQYAKDRLEYAFTDRAAREQREAEERRLQQLLEAAAAAAAKEAEEQRQQLWTQTMFAGACAFVGSVATNYIWAAL